jgi:hypothetical protein
MGLYGVLTGVAVILALAIGLNAAGVLHLRGSLAPKGVLHATGERYEGGLLQAQGEKPGALLEAQGEKPGPLLDQQPTETTMPADVRDWLEHLRITEEKRMSLAKDEKDQALVLLRQLEGAGATTEQLNGLLDDASGDSSSGSGKTPANTAVETTASMRAEWQKLTDFFNSKKPPTECAAIHDSYDEVVRETGGMMGDIIDIVHNVGDNPGAAIGKLEAMEGKSKNLIDKPATEADDGVAAICKKYDTRKWFDIQADPGGGGGYLGKLGL